MNWEISVPMNTRSRMAIARIWIFASPERAILLEALEKIEG
jgi:hypothetical protein